VSFMKDYQCNSSYFVKKREVMRPEQLSKSKLRFLNFDLEMEWNPRGIGRAA